MKWSQIGCVRPIQSLRLCDIATNLTTNDTEQSGQEAQGRLPRDPEQVCGLSSLMTKSSQHQDREQDHQWPDDSDHAERGGPAILTRHRLTTLLRWP